MSPSRLLVALGLALMAVAALPTTGSAHGGAYRPLPPKYSGPRDLTLPSSPTGVAAPSRPTGPPAPTTPTTPSPVAPPTLPGPANATTGGHGGVPLEADRTGWDTWWDYNRDRYLKIQASSVALAVTPRNAEGAATGTTLDDLVRDQTARLVVPALEKLFEERKPSSDLTTAALLALARAGAHPRHAERILPYLSHSNQEVAETAALALGVLRSSHVAGVLRSLLQDDAAGRKLVDGSQVPLRTREFAAYGLALLAEASPLRIVRQQAAEALIEVAERSGETIPISLQAACVIALAQVPLESPEDTVRRLAAVFRNDRRSDAVRAHVPNAIARLLENAPNGAQLAEPWVADWLFRLQAPKEMAYVRQACVQALGWVPLAREAEREPVELLIAVSKDDADSLVRNHALLSLGLIASRGGPTSQTLVMPYLLQVLEKGGYYERGWAALALGVMGYEARDGHRQIPALVSARLRGRLGSEKTPSVRGAIVIALGLLKDRDSGERLLELLDEHRDPDVQARVAVALGLLGETRAADSLRKLLRGSKRKPGLLRATAEGLTLLQDEEALPILVGYLADEPNRVLATTAAVAQAIGATRNARAVQPLLDLLEELRGPDLARAFAAAALGLLADRDELPFRARFSRCLNYRAAPPSLVDPAGAAGLLNLL